MPLSDDQVRQLYGLPPGTPIERSRGPLGQRLQLTPDTFRLHEIADPAIEWSVWDQPVVVAGATARLTVQGYGVGQGSPVRVTLRDGRGRRVGRGDGEMYDGRAVVSVEVERRAAGVAAADVALPELGLKAVSPPLTVVPFAELDRARWGQAEARDGDAVELSCRVTGTGEGVRRLEGQTARVEVLRGDEGAGVEGDSLSSLFEPVVTLRVPVESGRIEAQWRVGYDAEGKARIATQGELDAAASRAGAEAERYARPAWRFRVRLAGLVAESPELGYRDHVDLAWDAGTDRPAAEAPVEIRLADGTTREETLGADGRLRLDDVPPGPVEAAFGPDPRPWEPFPEALDAERPPPPTIPLPPDPPVRAAAPVLLASAGELDPALLAGLAGERDDDEDGFFEWFWGLVKGDFNEDPTYGQILATMAVTVLPGVDQVADVRDIVANIYVLYRAGDDEDKKKWAWFALVTTVLGMIPFVGSILKGVSRVALKAMRALAEAGADRVVRAGVLDEAADVLRRAFEGLGAGDPAGWLRSLDLGAYGRFVRQEFDRAMDYALDTLAWAQRRLDSALGRAAAAGAELVFDAGNHLRTLFKGRVPAEQVVKASPSLSHRVGLLVASLRRLKAEAGQRIESGLGEMFAQAEELVERASPRRPGAGVSGRTVEPDPPAWEPHPRPPGLEDGAIKRPFQGEQP